MATRKVVSRDELNKWLTNELQKVEDCEGSSLSVQYVLVEPDANGCNWSGAVATAGPNTTGAEIGAISAEITDRARSLFNIAQ